jgi:hypothetical protein
VELSADQKFITATGILLDTVQLAAKLGAEPSRAAFIGKMNSFIEANCLVSVRNGGLSRLGDPWTLGPSLWQTLDLASESNLRNDTNADNCEIAWKAWADPKYPETWPPNLIAPKNCEDPERHNDRVSTRCRKRFERIQNGSLSGDRAIFKVSTGFFGAAPAAIVSGDVLVIFKDSDGIMAIHPTETCYTVIGGVYLHGITDATKLEAIQGLYEQGVFEKHVFKIG